GAININVGDKMRVNLSRGNSVELYIPYEYKDMYKEVKESAFHKVTMEKGKNYEFKNTFDKKIQLITTADYPYNEERYDVIQYNSSGDIYSAKNDKDGAININVGDKMRVNLSRGNSVELYIPYEYKDMYKEVKESAFHKVTMEKGKNYEFKNTFDKKIQLITTANYPYNEERYDVIQYNSSGDIYSAKNDKDKEINLNVGDKMRVNLSRGNSVELYIPYEYKDMYKEVKEPAFHKVTMEKGKNYEFKNTFDKKIQLITTANYPYNEERYDVIQYKTDGDIDSVNKDKDKEINLNVGCKMKINLSKGNSVGLYIPYEYKDMYKEVKEPVFHELTMEKGKNYEFKNSSNKKIEVLTSAGSSNNEGKYDLLKFDSSGNIKSNFKNEYSEIGVNVGEKIRINISIGNNIKLYVPYEYKDMYKEVKEPVFHELTIEKGKNYEFNNSYSEAMKLVTSANNSSSENRYDIVKYNKSGEIYSSNKNEYGSIDLNAGDKMRINLSNGNNIKVYIPYDYKDMYKVVKEPVFYEFNIKTGESFVFKNNLNTRIKILSNADYYGARYDFDRYRSDGTSTSPSVNQTGYINLGAGEIVDIKLSKGTEVKFYLPYESMSGVVEKEDINNDKVIDVLDLAQVAVKYNEKSNIQKYNKHDINRDGIVDIYDIVLIAKKCA
ncbi:hypothetical protein KPL39_12990, partial [Clostridium gasigenes]|uniref:dockerin type I domain-containing protein n=1 Tax=Clostridium gasigenes TaxID=94869 RepID=UPI001C0C23BD